jgi:Na+/melibiose symporter-like transporter
MPYVLIGTPIAAVLFVWVAYGWAAGSFWPMFASLTIFNVAMAFYRAPVVALMPDLVPSEHRSKANGVINLMGGIGAIYAFAIASLIYKINDAGIGVLVGVPPAYSGPVLAFLTTSVIMMVAVLLLLVVVREPLVPPVDAQKPREMVYFRLLDQYLLLVIDLLPPSLEQSSSGSSVTMQLKLGSRNTGMSTSALRRLMLHSFSTASLSPSLSSLYQQASWPARLGESAQSS